MIKTKSQKVGVKPQSYWKQLL